MKILFVTYRVPYPPISGERLRVFQIIYLLLQKGYKVFLVTFVTSSSEAASIRILEEMGVNVRSIYLNLYWARLKSFSSFLIFNSIPIQCLLYSSRRMKYSIEKIVTNNEIDIVYTFLARMGQYFSPNLKAVQILDYMDAFSVFYDSRSSLSGKWSLSRIVDRDESRRLKRWEVKLLYEYDITTIITDYDARNISPLRPPVVIPTHVEDYLAYNTLQSSTLKKPSIIFFGEMSTYYSEHAVLFAIDKVMPLVWRQFKEATLYVVGSNPTKVIKSKACQRVVVTGYVEDMSYYIAHSDVSIVPVFMGSGLKNKIIQSMALKSPVVATSVANLGIEAQHGTHILIADNAAQFAESILSYLMSPDLRKSITNQAHLFAQQKYSQEIVYGRLVDAFKKAGVSNIPID